MGQVARGPGAAPAPDRRTWAVTADPAGVLTVGLCLLLLFPATQRLGVLGAVGAPSVLLGGALLAYWCLGWVSRAGWVGRGSRAVAPLVLAYLGSVVASYASAMTRTDLDTVEMTAADVAVISALGSVGVALLAADAVRSGDRMTYLLKGVVSAAGLVAAVGILHFLAGVDVTRWVALPGFESFVSDWDAQRSGFTRISATVGHPIEFSVVLAMVLPLALHVAIHRNPSRAWWWWACVAAIGVALPMTVSRTAVVAGVAVAAALLPTWPRRRIVRALVVAALGVVALRLVVPGLVGTLRSLVFGAASDPSVTARTSDYAIIERYLATDVLLGRGYGTFLPRRYIFVDNEYLLTAVTGGAIGLVALAALLVGGVVLARLAREAAVDPADRDLAQCLMAAMLVAALTALTYDAFSFGTGRALTFAVLGLVGAHLAVVRAGGGTRAASEAVPGAAVPAAGAR